MQQGCEDYSNDEDGCCINCEDAEDGCLCYACNCTKCFYYTSPDESGDYDKEGNPKGVCDIAVGLRERKREEYLEERQEYWSSILGGGNDYSKLRLPKSQKQLTEFK